LGEEALLSFVLCISRFDDVFRSRDKASAASLPIVVVEFCKRRRLELYESMGIDTDTFRTFSHYYRASREKKKRKLMMMLIRSAFGRRRMAFLHSHGTVSDWHGEEPDSGTQSRCIETLYLVRHGESEGNVAQRESRSGNERHWQNEEFRNRHTSRYRLTSRGREQAERAGQWLKERLFDENSNAGKLLDGYWTSEYVRAMETAAHLRLDDAKWRVEFSLRERDKGVLAGLSSSERDNAVHGGSDDGEASFIRLVERVRSAEPFFGGIAGGESLAQLAMRVDLFLAELNAVHRPEHRVVVVAHGNFIKVARARIEHLTEAMVQNWSDNKEHDIGNGDILEFTRRDPSTGDIVNHNSFAFARLVRTSSPSSASWHRIQWPRFTNDQLLQHVEVHPQIVENN
jgi:broad specificity phosphatase PhoE